MSGRNGSGGSRPSVVHERIWSDPDEMQERLFSSAVSHGSKRVLTERFPVVCTQSDSEAASDVALLAPVSRRLNPERIQSFRKDSFSLFSGSLSLS